jgi:uncharacterized membrane protein (DUF4010 family)
MTTVELFARLGLALAIGLLMGAERGWRDRELPEQLRGAGIRTFGMIGLAGGVAGALAVTLGGLVLAGAVLALTGLVISSRITRPAADTDTGFTTEVAELTAFCLGALAASGHMAAAAAAGVVATALLNAKETLHSWLSHVERLEMRAAIRLLLISVVMLPVLPDHGYGPGNALNPFRLWLMVVMVAGISFIGYFAIKIAGPRIGSLLTGVFGGLASSTALTLSFARMGRDDRSMHKVLAAGVAVANATMFLRLWVIILAVDRPMAMAELPPLAAMMAAGLIMTALLWRDHADAGKPGATGLTNPFELGVAIKFAILLAAVVIASRLLQSWAGSTGLYVLGAVAGLADVDAISLSMAEMAGHSVTLPVAAMTSLIAVFVNTAVHAAMVVVLCGGTMARRVILAIGTMIMAGILVIAGRLLM